MGVRGGAEGAFARLFEIASELRGESVRLRRRRGAFRRERLHATFRRREAPSKFPLYRSRTRGFLALRRERLARVREFLRRARQITPGLLQRRGFLLEAFLKRVRSSARLARATVASASRSRRVAAIASSFASIASRVISDARSICARAWSLDRENSSATDANEDARRALEPTNQAAGPDAAGRDSEPDPEPDPDAEPARAERAREAPERTDKADADRGVEPPVDADDGEASAGEASANARGGR